jgi:2-oxoglutarate dehydrogenase E1 component
MRSTKQQSTGVDTSADTFKAVHEAYKVNLIIRAFMTHGHLIADLDPLNMAETYKEFENYGNKFKVPQSKLTSLVDYKNYGFTDSDLEREFYIDAPELHGVLSKKKIWKLQELVSAYKNAYC